eukprot:8053308-Ditylum_brightwellii.AAC.1
MEEERSARINASVSNNRYRYQDNRYSNSSSAYNSNHLTLTVPTNSLTSIAGPTVVVTTMSQHACHQQMDINPLQHFRMKWVATQRIVKHDSGEQMRFDIAVIYK